MSRGRKELHLKVIRKKHIHTTSDARMCYGCRIFVKQPMHVRAFNDDV